MNLTAAHLLNFLATAAAGEADESPRFARLEVELRDLAADYGAELEGALELAVANGLDAPTGDPRGTPTPATDPEACPGCACLPGDGLTDGCDDPAGCGFYRANACAEVLARAEEAAEDAALDDEHDRAMLEVCDD
jgi:hypothetical protein